MAIIIIEGGEVVGKTSIVRALQDKIPYHTLLKLSGLPTSKITDMKERGKMMEEQYNAVIPLLFSFSRQKGIERTLIIDRFSTTEKVMYRESFDYGNLLKAERYAVLCQAKQVILSAPAHVITQRFDNRCKASSLESQTLSAILDVHRRYIHESVTSPISTAMIVNDGSLTVDEIADKIINLFKIPIYQIND